MCQASDTIFSKAGFAPCGHKMAALRVTGALCFHVQGLLAQYLAQLFNKCPNFWPNGTHLYHWLWLGKCYGWIRLRIITHRSSTVVKGWMSCYWFIPLAPIHTALSREDWFYKGESGCCWELGIWRMHADTETANVSSIPPNWLMEAKKIPALNSVFHPNWVSQST